MNQSERTGLHGTQVVQELSEETDGGPPSRLNGKTPYLPHKEKAVASLKENSRLLIIGAGIVLVLLLLALSGISHRSSPAAKTSSLNAKLTQAPISYGTRPPASVIPILDAGRAAEQDGNGGLVNPEQIRRTATKPAKPSPGMSLGNIRPFGDSQAWEPAPFQPGSESANVGGRTGVAAEAREARSEHGAMDKASLVFVRNNPSSAARARSQDTLAAVDSGIGLPPGTRLRARLESAVSTAVRTPVVAVVEYNYEQNGEIAIPAGAKAFGRLEAADRSGYVGIHFDSLSMPDGSSVDLEAAATDLQLRPVRGKVEGKHAAKNILVHSLAGVGQVAATLAGRGSLNQPLSEADLLRERVSNNIGETSDQAVANLALTEHIVVSIPADTEIYLILQRPAREKVQNPSVPPISQNSNQPSIDELRQLWQLQLELNQTAINKPTPQ